MKRLIYILPALLFLGSCTKYVDIELNSALQRIVIEALITDLDNPPTVKLMRTTDYFNPAEPEFVTGANVVMKASSGEEETLEEVSPGFYQAVTLRGQNGVQYSLTVKDGEDVYEAVAYLPERVSIDSLVYEPSFFGFTEDTVTQYILTSWFNDPVDRPNYYQFRIAKTPVDTVEQQMGPPMGSQAILLNDINFNGRTSSYNLNRIGYYYVGDTVDVELISLGSAVYQYLDQLNEITGSMLFGSSAPANPENNITNGAMGFFAAEAIDRKVIIIKE